MILYALGIITGIGLSAIVLLASIVFKTSIERTVHQAASRLRPKGSILELDDEEVDKWVQSLPHD